MSTYRMTRLLHFYFALGSAGFLTLGISPTLAQTYPTKPIRFIIPYGTGGAVDFVARAVVQKLSEALGQPVIVENRVGGASNIGSDLVAKARPDGYTLLAGSSAHALNGSIFEKMPYNVLKDLAPVILIGSSANILLVNPSLPARSVKELIALAKSRPSELTYASGGNATSGHVAGELFKSLAQVNILHVPYKGGGAPAITDLLGGRIDMYFSSLPSALPFVKNNKLRALGATSEKRAAAAPDMPSIAEAGLPGYAIVAWHAVFAPAGTAQDIIEKLNAEIVRILNITETRARLETQGIDISGGTPSEFAVFLKTEIEKYAKLVKTADIKVD